jgi:hypothetical protein
MGIRVQMSPHLFRLMSPADRARYAAVAVPDIALAPRLDHRPSAKTTSDERKEQGTFANWLLLQNSKGRKIPFSWHATHTRSKATPGTPDFWLGINAHSMWIEFKRDCSCKLSPEQEEFRVCCAYQGIEWHLVYSAPQAIEIVEEAAGPVTASAARRTT